MKLADPNYQPPEQTFDQFPDGPCKVKGFEWFSKDDKDRPILVAQKDLKLVGRLRFNLPDGEEGPPMSVTLGQMIALAQAFGVKTVPSVPDEGYAAMVTKFMIEIRNLCQDKEMEVEVKNGWVNTLPNMEVPEGGYWFYISDISSPEKDGKGQPKPKQGEWGSFFFVTFTVDSEKGQPSKYKGLTFSELVNYPVKVVEGQAELETNKDGTFTADAARFSKLLRLGDPDTFAGEFTTPNPYNLLPYMKEKILPARRMLEGTRVIIERKNKGVTTRRLGLSWPGLKEAEGAPQRRIIDEMNVEDKVRHVLVEALDKLAEGKSTVVNGSFSFTDAGKAVAKKYLSPLRKEGLIQHGSLEELTVEEVTTILTTLVNEVGPEFKERVVMLGVGFEPLKEEVEEDSPF